MIPMIRNDVAFVSSMILSNSSMPCGSLISYDWNLRASIFSWMSRIAALALAVCVVCVVCVVRVVLVVLNSIMYWIVMFIRMHLFYFLSLYT
jgi:hypothetical protein